MLLPNEEDPVRKGEKGRKYSLWLLAAGLLGCVPSSETPRGTMIGVKIG
jgi:hypothetical protein